MRKNALIILMSIAILFAMQQQLSCQITTEIDSTVLWVKIDDLALLPTSDPNEFTDHSGFNQFLHANGINYYDFKYQGTTHPELKMHVEIRFQKTDPFLIRQTLLNSAFSSMIADVFIEEYVVQDISLYDPSDYHWVWAPEGQDFLWHLKKIQAGQAWDITLGDPNIKIAVLDTDFDVNHNDFTDQLVYDYDPYSGQPFSCNGNQHGTEVAGMASAETAETGEDAAGQYASVGFNTKLLLYNATLSFNTFLQKVHHAVLEEGARVIVTAAYGGIFPCNPANCPDETATIIEEIFNHGAVVVMPAGDGLEGYNCSMNDEYVPVGCLNPFFDSRIIVVTSSSMDDTHEFILDGVNLTHSHFSEVDLCAPGYQVSLMTGCPDEGGWPYRGAGRGTSYASPLVAGCAALILSIDPCLEAGDVEYILKATTDPIVDAANFPGQVGTGRVNIFQACSLAQNYGIISLNQSGTTLISSDVYSSTDIEILDGMTVELTGILRMSSGKKIIVHPGGSLIINGGIVTNSKGCDEPWQGIEVWGNHDALQTPSNQGVLELKNDAVIENAANAVTLWKPGDWSKTGGIIKASNSQFRNNKRSVEFMAFQNVQGNGYIGPNRSYFRDCDFVIDEDYLLEDEGNFQQITMYKVNGVRILGCDFIYDRPVSSIDQVKQAIFTSDANFTIDNYCLESVFPGDPCPDESVQHSTFTGYDHAVHVTGAEWNVGPEIKDAEFSENMVGINFDAVVAAAAIQNEFTVGGNNFAPNDLLSPDFHLGIKVNNCDEYIIDENKFFGDDSNGWLTHGVYTYDEIYSANSNEIYNNEYQDLSSGNIAVGFHADPAEDETMLS